jgi:hypothetical protein
MAPDCPYELPVPGSCIRIVYSIEGFELFAIGVLVQADWQAITLEQYSDQYGPIEPFRSTIPWSAITYMTVGGRTSRSESFFEDI